jgi:hypothetical protein
MDDADSGSWLIPEGVRKDRGIVGFFGVFG